MAENNEFVPTRQDIEQAIIALEANRSRLGDDVASYTLAALHQALSELTSSPFIVESEPMTVLVADLSGFTAMAEGKDAETVRDTINALWNRLDSVIAAWGGRVETHTGDGVISLFPEAPGLEDDAERAIQAALEMQMSLALFNETAVGRNGAVSPLKMRIGIHRGPIFFRKIGVQEMKTAVGEPIDIANQLEEMAAEAGTLISYDVYWRIHTRFEVETLDPVRLAGKTGLLHVYHVIREHPRTFRSVYRVFEAKPRLVGRSRELETLQQAVQDSMEQSRSRLMLVTGESGVGKTRLMYELAVLIELLPVKVCQLMGQAHPGAEQTPYALFLNLLLNFLGIHTQGNLQAARSYLIQGVEAVIQEVDEIGASQKAEAIAHLLGMDEGRTRPKKEPVSEVVRHLALHGLTDFIRGISKRYLAVVVFLEDLQWADEGSLDLIENLLHECRNLPVMIAGLARPSFFVRRPSWHSLAVLDSIAFWQIQLEPLSAIDSRHLVIDSLTGGHTVPVKLTDLIVEKAGGNPFYIEELLKMLVDEQVLFKEGDAWRADPVKLAEMQQQPTLTGMLTLRLEALPLMQQSVMRHASVMGRVFWGTAVIYLAGAEGDIETQSALQDAIELLVETGFFSKRQNSTIPGSVEYVFRHRQMRVLVYRQIPPNERQILHAQAAAWLIVHSSQSSEHAGVIARQFERALDYFQASDWYDRAGTRSVEGNAPETAVTLFQKALALLPDQETTQARRLGINHKLAQLLLQLARYDQATTTFKSMLDTAETVKDHNAMMQAWLGIITTQYHSKKYPQALASSRQAETVARSIEDKMYLASALTAQGWPLVGTGKIEEALNLARQGLELAEEVGSKRVIAHSKALIGHICLLQNWQEQGIQTTKDALTLFRELDDNAWSSYMLVNLGQLAQRQGQFVRAGAYYQDGLRLARMSKNIHGALLSLRQLSELARQLGDFQQATQLAQQAYILADRSQNPALGIRFAVYLGKLANYQFNHPAGTAVLESDRIRMVNIAHEWFDKASDLVRETNLPTLDALVRLSLAQLLVDEDSLEEAVALAHDALITLQEIPDFRQNLPAQKLAAVAWHILGQIAARLPESDTPLMINRKPYDASRCFALSTKLYSNIRVGVAAERAFVLREWAIFELYEGDREMGNSLWQRALRNFTRLNMVDEIDWMKEFETKQANLFNHEG